MNVASCRTCGRSVVWTKTANQKWMPVDAEAVEHGNIMLAGVDDQGTPPQAVVCRTIEEKADAKSRGFLLYRSHFVTCPQAKTHRRKKT